MADHPCRIKLSLLPLLTRKTLPGLRFARLAAAQKSPRGLAVRFADGRRVFLGARDPLASLSVGEITALTNGLPGLLTDAITALGVDDLIARDGSFSQKFVHFALSRTDALDGPARDDLPRVADALIRWLEIARHDYTVDMTLQFDWAEAVLGDLQVYISLQLNQATGVILPGRNYVDLDGDGNSELYFIDADGNVFDPHMKQVGKIDTDDSDDEKGCAQRAWDWLTDSGIMWGKEGPMRLPTFITARFLDQHRLRLRALVTDVAAGQTTVPELAAAAQQLIDLSALKRAYLAAPRRGTTDPAALRAVRLTATPA